MSTEVTRSYEYPSWAIAALIRHCQGSGSLAQLPEIRLTSAANGIGSQVRSFPGYVSFLRLPVSTRTVPLCCNDFLHQSEQSHATWCQTHPCFLIYSQWIRFGEAYVLGPESIDPDKWAIGAINPTDV